MQPDNQFQPQNPMQPPVPPTTPPQPEMPAQPAPLGAMPPAQTFGPANPAAPAAPTIMPSSYQPPAPAPEPLGQAPMAPAMPGPAAPQPQTTAMPPTPVMGGAMSAGNPGMPPQQPNYQSASSQGSSSAGLGIAAMVASLLPLVGFILGIVSIIKGFKSNNKKLKLFGGIAIVLSLLLSALYFAVVIPAVGSLLGTNYSKTQQIDVSGTGYSYKITIPAAFAKEESASTSNARSAFSRSEPQVNYVIYKDKEKKEGVIAMFSYQVTDMSSLKRLAERTGQKLTPDMIIKEALKNTSGLEDAVTKETANGKFKNAKVVDVKQDGKGLVVRFTAEGASKDGKKVDVVGRLAIYLNDDLIMINTGSFAKKSVWEANSKVFEGIHESVSSQVNGGSAN